MSASRPAELNVPSGRTKPNPPDARRNVPTTCLASRSGLDFIVRAARPSVAPESFVVAEATTPATCPPAEAGSPAAKTWCCGPHASSPDFTICLMIFFNSRARSSARPNFLAITAGLTGW